MNYQELIRPWQIYKFNKPRQNNGSKYVVVCDTFFNDNVAKDYLKIMDIRNYHPNESRVFKDVFVLDFLMLIEKKIIEIYIPL